MKEVECEVIKDLLPKYSNKISSKETNKIIEEHIKDCPDCAKVLENMNKEAEYLKKFKKRKMVKRIAIVLVILVIFLICARDYIYGKYFIDIDNDIKIEYEQMNSDVEEEFWTFAFNSPNYVLNCEEHYDAYNIEIEVTGKKSKNENKMTYSSQIHKNKNIIAIYVKNKKGDKKKIWDCEEGILVPIKNYSEI